MYQRILQDPLQFPPDMPVEAQSLIAQLLNRDPSRRLGANGAAEVKAHPFFNGVECDSVTKSEPASIHQVTDPETTDYFDLRGATPQLFHEDDAIPVGQSAATPEILGLGGAITAPIPIEREHACRDKAP